MIEQGNTNALATATDAFNQGRLAEAERLAANLIAMSPDDADALAGALCRLRDDPSLGEQLSARARSEVAKYTWEARARRILRFARERAK